MFGCIYQLWDWLEAPPLFNGAMDPKKLQALQQQAVAQKKFPLAYQTNISDYHTATHSPVFSQQHHHQQHTAPHQLAGYQMSGFQQSPTATSSSGGPLTPIDLQPQSNNKLLLKHVLGGGNSSSSSHSSPYHQSYTSSGIAAGSSDMYQSPSERTYMTSAGRTQANPASALQQQYQQLQQAKLQLQLQTQNEAMQQQQRTFALRQAMNPPVPQSHYHMSQSSSIVSTMTMQQQQQQQQHEQLNKQHAQQAQQQQQQLQRAPPSSLNLASQFQPAPGPLKMQQQQRAQQQQHQQHYQQQDVHNMHGQQQVQQQLQLQLQHQQQLQQQQQQQQNEQHHHLHKTNNEQSPVYIQQNHPGHVVNQACQTQISAVKPKSLNQQQKATPSSEESSGKSPVHAPLDRKKSISSVQALKSPIAKRPPSSPVSLSGWLYKQGSEGLKVWRKRWFVLAEYCLYYYKGPEEEKLLGSILLPSYRVSACLPEDKIYRKFAFKCEHQNMRTYWLAAENGESMVQWVRALTAATMMQAPSSSGDSDQTSQPSGSSSLNHSGDNSDSGIHTLKSQQSKGQMTPASENGAGTLSTTLNASGMGEGNQPLYANAPPKPRRINDGGYSSPSPEQSIDAERKYQQQLKQNVNTARRSGGIMSPNLQHQQQHMLPQKQQHLQRQQPQPQQHHAIYDTRTGNVTTALSMQQPLQQYSVDNLEGDLQQKLSLSDEYSKSPPPPTPFNNYLEMEEQILRLQQQHKQELSAGLEDIYGERELYMQKLIRQRHLSSHANNERRTPDAYGRSKNRMFSDYEDIYNLAQSGQHAQAALLQEAASYRRPLSPPSYDSSKHMPGLSLQYTPHQLEPQTSRIRPVSSIMRPHSADFLDFEARAEAAATTVENEISGLTNFLAPSLKSDVLRTPRPKSSLDINRTADSVYYSEASYAEKMRKSALYLQSPSRNPNGQQQNFINPLGNNSGLHTIGYENPYERAYKRHELLNEMTAGDVQSVPRLSRSATAGTNAHIRATSARPELQQQQQQQEKQQAVQQQPPPPPPQLQAPVLSPSLPTQQIIQQNEQFLRSASARLPKRSGGFEEEYNNSTSNSNSTVSTSAVGHNSQVGNILNGVSTSSNMQPDGEKKREESMKRLLEWKQRMLQSPLTRKGVQQQQQQQNSSNSNNKMSSLSKLGSNPNILLSSTTVASGAFYNQANLNNNVASDAAGNASAVGNVSGIQRSRSETQANATYNSYSSDDEASISVRNVRNLPKGNLTVKPDASDVMQQQQQQQKQQLTNLYYGSTQDTKYAKSTALADRVNSTENTFLPHRKTEHMTNGGMLTVSTPLQQGPTVAGGFEYFNGTALNHNIYEAHNGYAQQQQTKHAQERQQNLLPLRRVGSRAEIDMLERETSNQMRKLDVSAGDLLSRTHEELVLLLIQLRRQNSITARAIEQCCSDMHEVQNRLRTADGLTRAESIQRLDYLKQHLLDLERQYERSKPVVNLVDNMVKLGSLYRNNDAGQQQRQTAVTLDRLEYNQRIQERRQQLEQQKNWDMLSPNQQDLQSKVNQLYQLDQLLQQESGTLQHLQRNKDDLERALGGIRARIHNANETPMALEAAKKEQLILENELSHVHQLLSENSKKLEQTVAGNTRLEQELCILRQKLQASRGSQNMLTNGWTNGESNDTAAKLETELKRVQNLVGDMQRQRQELSSAVRQLTENSNRLYHEIGNKESSLTNGYRKRSNSASWVETDLDSLKSMHRGLHDSSISLATPLYVETNGDIEMDSYENDAQTYGKMSEFSAEDIKRAYGYTHYNGIDSEEFSDTNPFTNLSQQERQEIKTVRIVKRESERRHRDRSERSNGLSNSIQNLDHLLEEESAANYQTQLNGFGKDDYAQNARTKSLPRDYNEHPKLRHPSKHHNHHGNAKSGTTDAYRNSYANGNHAMTNDYHERAETQQNLNPLANAYFAKQLQQQSGRCQAQNALRQKTDSVHSLNKSITDLSPGPVFQSEAARQIMCEISAGSASEDTEKVVEKVPSQHKHRRSVPREKRRHYTAPNNVNIKAMENVQAENDMNRNNTNWRARDDLDMDLALRPRLNAPDVVRSALGQGEKISENTIDNLLLAPNKIVIPERYIPEKTPELSAEEKKRRQEKVESIKKMLAETPISSANDNTVTIPPSKLNAEKKQREHLLQLNQILAQQVMQMSKIVAGNSPTNPN